MQASALSATPAFRGLQMPALLAAGPLFDAREVAADAALWLHGERAEELALVVRGRLAVTVAGVPLGEVGEGELVGEASAFFGDWRTATLTATAPSSLLVLDSRKLPTLRAEHPAVYDALLEHTLVTLARRVADVDRLIARKAAGDGAAPSRQQPGVLQQLVKRLLGPPPSRPVPLGAVLRKLPALGGAEAEVLAALEAAMTAHRLPAGEVLVLEGEPGSSVFLLADGCVEVIRGVRGRRGETLATLAPGALLGTGSLLLGERRNASCVAADTTEVQVWELTREAHRALGGEAGRRWREALLSAVRSQLARANEKLAALERGGRVDTTDYDRLRAELSGFSGGEVREPVSLRR